MLVGHKCTADSIILGYTEDSNGSYPRVRLDNPEIRKYALGSCSIQEIKYQTKKFFFSFFLKLTKQRSYNRIRILDVNCKLVSG